MFARNERICINQLLCTAFSLTRRIFYHCSIFFRTVELIMLQLQSNSSKPAVLEKFKNSSLLSKSRPLVTGIKNVAFIARTFNTSQFQSDTMGVLLRESEENRRRKREASEAHVLVSGATYRVTQINRDGLGVGIL